MHEGAIVTAHQIHVQIDMFISFIHSIHYHFLIIIVFLRNWLRQRHWWVFTRSFCKWFFLISLKLSFFVGTDCDEDIDDCSPDPCVNGACTDTGADSYECACDSGWEGKLKYSIYSFSYFSI